MSKYTNVIPLQGTDAYMIEGGSPLIKKSLIWVLLKNIFGAVLKKNFVGSYPWNPHIMFIQICSKLPVVKDDIDIGLNEKPKKVQFLWLSQLIYTSVRRQFLHIPTGIQFPLPAAGCKKKSLN